MAYDTIKIEKGLYTTGKSFTQTLFMVLASLSTLTNSLLKSFQTPLLVVGIKVFFD